MNYNLDADLTCSKQARVLYYNQKHVPINDQSQKTLLTKYKNSIKKGSTIVPIVKMLPSNSLPESYCKIKNHLADQIKKSLG